MLDWGISLLLGSLLIGLAMHAHNKLGTVRAADQRPHKLPWGLILIFCGFALFMILVHLLNLLGLETGPEHSPMMRF